MPPAVPGAVFLSYASQDTAAARRICEALRVVGIEVWFDQNELRGGDAWDAKIRRQIKDCVLFLPVISANTQARPEGYFRLEWKLAVDRSHLMAHDEPFIVPVIVDDVPEASARVPDKFRDVQWTLLRGGDTPAEFCARVKQLLAGDSVATSVAHTAGSGRAALSTAPLPPRRGVGRVVGFAAAATVIVGIALAFAAGWWPRQPRSEPSSAPPTASANPSTPPASPPTKAQALVSQARALYEPWDFANPEDFKLAEQLLNQALELEPANADASAALAIVSAALNLFGIDRSDARDRVLRSAADRAVKLAPKSDYAQLALALRYRLAPGTDDEALQILTQLAARRPDDKLIHRQLGSVLSVKGRDEEALASYARAAALPGGDAIALALQARTLQRLERLDEAEAALDQAIALRPDYGFGHISRLTLAFYGRGDIERVRKALREIPARVLSDDRVAAVAAVFWYFARDPDRAADALRHMSSDYIESHVVTVPKGLLAGVVHRMAGRAEAAAIEWRQALRLLEQRLAARPGSSGDLGDKAGLLAYLGQRAEAEEALRVFEQLRRIPPGRANSASWQIYAELGHDAAVANFFSERFKSPANESPQSYAALFRYHPALDRFRALPRFQELAKEADRFFSSPANPATLRDVSAGSPNSGK